MAETEQLAILETPVVPAAPRAFWGRVLIDTMRKAGARVGVAWVVVLGLLAVFGPLIANSHPYLMKVDGRWSSPLIDHLYTADVTLIAVFVLGVIVLPWRRVGLRKRMILWLGASAIVFTLAYIFVAPPRTVVYERYRELEAAGKIESIFRAPIPFSPNDRFRDRPDEGLLPPWWSAAPGTLAWKANHWLGNESNNADVASRMIHAARVAMAVGFIATGIGLIIGVTIGSLMGYFVGPVDLLGMRLVEIFEFIPQLFLLLMVVAFFPGDNPEVLPGVHIARLYLMMIVIGLTGWSGYARFIRAEFLKLRKQDFVQAAIACGLPLRSILFKHMLPNGLTPVLVSASFGVASAILAEATLSFLGLGLIEDPSWGQLLNQATRSSGGFVWWIATFPGLAIFLTVFAYNLVGEALRDAIDPHLRKAAQL